MTAAFACFAEHSPLAAIEWSVADLRVARWSESAARLFGWRADEAVGKRADELNLVGADDAPAARDAVAELASGKHRRNLSRQRNLRRDGSVIHCEWYNSVVGTTRRSGSILSLVLDVTARERAEEEARATKIQLAGIVKTLPCPLTTIDRELRYTAVSDEATRLLGKSRDELVGHSMKALFPEAARVFRAHCERAWREQKPVSFEYYWAPQERWYELFCYPFGNELSIQGHDIDERKRAEQTLRESELRLRTILDHILQGYAIYDADRRFEYISAKSLALTGRTLDDVVGKRDEELWPREVTRMYVPHLVRACETGLPQKCELDTKAVTGEQFTKLINFVPIKDSEGKVRQVLAATYDLTERKRFERALLEADRRKNEFLALLSHELRNPLTPIRYSLFILDRAPPRSEQAQRAKAIIDRQVDHLARIVDDLLDVTRITRGKIKLQRSLFDLGTLMRRTIEDHESLFTTAGVSLHTELTDERLIIDGDPARIAQVLGNLLQNAAKFTPRGGRVFLTLKSEPAQPSAIISLRDTGVGISSESLSRLFQPFEQAAETLDRSSGGLGLGLALVKAMIEMHGGQVEARSNGPGTGAEFIVRLPFETDRAAEMARVHTPTWSPSRRVLVIEDNIDSAHSLRELLNLAKHEVEVAYNGPDGLDKARRFKPEVVFCDIGLPGMNGYQLAKAFRSDQSLRSVYLVALTGYASPEDRAKAREAGFDQHLAKPPGLPKLHEILAAAPVRN